MITNQSDPNLAEIIFGDAHRISSSGGKAGLAGSAGVLIPDNGEITPLGGTGILISSGELGIVSCGSPGM